MISTGTIQGQSSTQMEQQNLYAALSSTLLLQSIQTMRSGRAPTAAPRRRGLSQAARSRSRRTTTGPFVRENEDRFAGSESVSPLPGASSVISILGLSEQAQQGTVTQRPAALDCLLASSDGKQTTMESFQQKINRMLQETAAAGKEDTVSLSSSGNAFLIHKPEVFARTVLPTYFPSTRIATFQRSLLCKGFRRVSSGPDKGGYSSPSLMTASKKTSVLSTSAMTHAFRSSAPRPVQEHQSPVAPALAASRAFAASLRLSESMRHSMVQSAASRTETDPFLLWLQGGLSRGSPRAA